MTRIDSLLKYTLRKVRSFNSLVLPEYFVNSRDGVFLGYVEKKILEKTTAFHESECFFLANFSEDPGSPEAVVHGLLPGVPGTNRVF